MIEQKTDYEKLTELLLEQWKNSNRLKGILEAAGIQANKMEAAAFEIRDLMYLETAVGKSLDFIGKIFQVPRAGLSDNQYRIEISKKSSTFYSGEPEVIMGILRTQYGATYIHYTPEYPGKYRIRTDSTIKQIELDSLSSAGVTGFLAGFLVDVEGNRIVEFGGFVVENILDEGGNFLVNAESDTLSFPVENVPSNPIIHIAG